jgi:hypothetical protein
MARPESNRPGGLANPPQHLVGEGPDVGEPQLPIPAGPPHRDTGPGTAPPGLDVADPHPLDEGHPYRGHDTDRRDVPGSPDPRREADGKDIGAYPEKHTGSAPPRPHNAGSGPE